jgi:hypothetical protein
MPSALAISLSGIPLETHFAISCCLGERLITQDFDAVMLPLYHVGHNLLVLVGAANFGSLRRVIWV